MLLIKRQQILSLQQINRIYIKTKMMMANLNIKQIGQFKNHIQFLTQQILYSGDFTSFDSKKNIQAKAREKQGQIKEICQLSLNIIAEMENVIAENKNHEKHNAELIKAIRDHQIELSATYEEIQRLNMQIKILEQQIQTITADKHKSQQKNQTIIQKFIDMNSQLQSQICRVKQQLRENKINKETQEKTSEKVLQSHINIFKKQLEQFETMNSRQGYNVQKDKEAQNQSESLKMPQIYEKNQSFMQNYSQQYSVDGIPLSLNELITQNVEQRIFNISNDLQSEQTPRSFYQAQYEHNFISSKNSNQQKTSIIAKKQQRISNKSIEQQINKTGSKEQSFIEEQQKIVNIPNCKLSKIKSLSKALTLSGQSAITVTKSSSHFRTQPKHKFQKSQNNKVSQFSKFKNVILNKKDEIIEEYLQNKNPKNMHLKNSLKIKNSITKE